LVSQRPLAGEATPAAEDLARATLEKARAEAERIRISALKDAARIRADARAAASVDSGRVEHLRALEAEIESLSRGVAAIEARRPPRPAEAPDDEVEVDFVPDVERAAPAAAEATIGARTAPLSSHERPWSIPLEAVLPIVGVVVALIVVLAIVG
jgi:hypothetical protein